MEAEEHVEALALTVLHVPAYGVDCITCAIDCLTCFIDCRTCAIDCRAWQGKIAGKEERGRVEAEEKVEALEGKVEGFVVNTHNLNPAT